MSQFDFWQQWGAQLDDTQFANAWAALGVAWNRNLDSPRDALEHRFDIPAGYRVPWRFPPGDPSADLIAGTTPLEWAAAWSEAAAGRELRLAVSGAPDGEPVMPWLRLLSETNPATTAVGVDLFGWADRTIQIASPLRLGYLPGNGAESFVDTVQLTALAGPNVKVSIGPASSLCDVLIFRGTPAELLGNTAVVGRANFLLLLGADGPDYGSDRAKVAADLNLLGAAGFAISRTWPTAAELTSRLSRFLQAIAQDRYFDEAVEESFGQRYGAAGTRLDLYAAYMAVLASHRMAQPVPPVPQQAPKMSAPEPRAAAAPAPEAAPPPKRKIFDWLRPRRVSPPAPKDTASAGPAARPPLPGNSTRSAGPTAGPRAVPPRPRQPEKKPEARFLRQESFAWHQGVKKKAENGFIAGQAALVSVSIGLPDKNLDTLSTPFPVQDLPQNLDEWTLDVWLTEPDHLDEPLRAEIKLPREGNSSPADFEFTPKDSSPGFEGRLSVLHRGRVIQTAVLRASVQPDAPVLQPGRKPKLEDHVHVRHAIGDLKNRRQFDLAFVLNHTEAGQPRAVALADKRAWIANLDEARACAGNISKKLAQITQSAPDYADGIRSPKGRALLVDLAREGVKLRRALVREQINAAGNQASIAREEFVQVVSTRPDSVIPFEFIYDFDAPETDAPLCGKWDQAIKNGKLPEPCTKHTKDEVCPMGFWGLQKVIERHQVSPGLGDPGKPLYLQSEPSESRAEIQLAGTSVFGASKRVSDDAIKSLAKKLKTVTGKDADRAKDWDDWVKAVKRSRPKLLIALAHSDGAGTNAGMEIGGKALADVMVTSNYILFDEGDPSPLVALLGCDTVGTTDIYSNYARTFRGEGAAIVVATIATVLAAQAATVAESLVAGLLSKDAKAPTRVGEVLRAIKRQALLDKQIMPLCLVAYGDADWQIKRN